MKNMKMKPTNVVLRPDDVKRCQAWGKELNLSASEVIRVAIDMLLISVPPKSLRDALLQQGAFPSPQQ